MANLMRLRNLQSLVGRLPSLTARTPGLSTQVLAQCRFVGTSNDKKSVNTPTFSSVEEDPCNPKKTWSSYGFDNESQYADRHMTHVIFFLSISLCLVGGGYIMMYMPDNKHKDWAQREAYIILREREAAGLPPIDINMIDPAKVKLPTDEELGDTDVII